MSIVKNISTLPDTRRTLTSTQNNYGNIEGAFAAKKTFSFASIEDFKNIDNWYQALSDGNIIPLHRVYEVDNRSEETVYNESIQDYTYMSRIGKIRYVLKYDWTVDYYQVVEQLSGSDLYVFFYDVNKNVYGTSDDGVSIRGFKTSRLQLEKMPFQIGQEPSFSPLDIEFKDSNEWVRRGVVEQVTWLPSEVDRLFISIRIEYVDSSNLNFSATWLSEGVQVDQAGVTLTDDSNGELTFNFYDYSGGVHRLSDFYAGAISSSLTSGILNVQTDLYLGCARYIVIAQIEVTNYFLYENDDRLALENSDLLTIEYM